MGAFKQLGEKIGDLSKLTVITFSGNINSEVVKAPESIADFKSLMEFAKSSGIVSLEAMTEINIDGDTTNFISSDIQPVISATHQAAFNAAQDYRQGIISMLKKSLNLGPNSAPAKKTT